MNSIQTQVSDGTLSAISVGLDFIEEDDIYVYLNGSLVGLTAGTDYVWANPTTIQMLKPNPVPAGQYVQLVRRTDADSALNIFDGNAAFNRSALDANFEQLLLLAQESQESWDRLVQYVNARNAAQDQEIDAIDARVDSLSAGLPSTNAAFPWRTTTTVSTKTISPPFTFYSALVFIDGLVQTYGTAYSVQNNVITLAEAIPPGTEVFTILGSSVMAIDALAAAISNLSVSAAPEDTSYYPVVRSGVGYKVSQANLRTAIVGGITSIPGSAASLSTARNIAMTGDVSWSVNFDGSSNVTASGTLSATGVTAGTYSSVTVDAKGRVTGASAAAPTATALATSRSITATGDGSWTVNFNGTANVSAAFTLANLITAGDYRGGTHDAKGRLTAGKPFVHFSATKDGVTAQTITQGVTTKITFQVEDFDSANAFDLANGRFTAPVAGVYLFHFQVGVTSGAAADAVSSQLWVSTTSSGPLVRHTNGSGPAQCSVFPTGLNSAGAAMVSLAAGGYVELYSFLTAAANRSANINAGNCYLNGTLIS